MYIDKILELSWNLFSLLFQGACGGVIVVFVAEYLRKRREDAAIRNYATLVWAEVQAHQAVLNEINTRKSLPSDNPPFLYYVN